MKEDFYGRSCFLVKLVLIHINHIVIVQDFLLVDLGLDDVFDPAFCAAHVVGGDKIGNAAVDKADHYDLTVAKYNPQLKKWQKFKLLLIN